ncbi:MAG: superoxide dismutase family protein [Gordonia sp. (in: high G+C Gram-positive bacteria)]|uniref:superoxide dismutase family protein n=1 Tax=Gordonia sp. (in: high G+C Gram-positive bacteria) TaxID=84139 RepID=UPI0039E26B93
MNLKNTATIIGAAAALGLVLSGCSNSEKPADPNAPYTIPSVITGAPGSPGGAAPEEHGGHGDEAAGDHGGAATAKIIDAKRDEIGTATFTKEGKGVKVVVTVNKGLEKGFHGMHLHTNGVCEPDKGEAFSTAGGHLQVDGHTGHPSSGDLVSIYIGEDGSGTVTTTTEGVTIDQIKGKSIIIHAGADNFGNIPDRYSAAGKPGPDQKTMDTGDAGARAACGVIAAG